jgi:TPR repeat protein
MARCELADIDGATLAPVNASGEAFFELGMTYASGRSVPTDLVSAHKWFNLAAQKGHADAARMRREIAAEMSDSEIGQAQRAARDWLKSQSAATPAVSLELRVAA